MPFEKILSEVTDGVLTLTMNDPKTRNALGEVMTSELMSELERFADSPDLRVLVLTGAGASFCSGADVRRFASNLDDQESTQKLTETREGPWSQLDPVYTLKERQTRTGPEVVIMLRNLQKPSIAAVNGHAYGVGCGMAISCDFRVAAESAMFNEAFIRNGLVAGDGSTWQLPKLVGLSQALWMQYSGEPINGQEAFRIGLANAVTSDEQLMGRALEMAAKLAKGPVFAMGLLKQMVQQGYNQDFSDHLRLASRAQALARNTSDHKEGVRAFLEKRPPNFEGR